MKTHTTPQLKRVMCLKMSLDAFDSARSSKNNEAHIPIHPIHGRASILRCLADVEIATIKMRQGELGPTMIRDCPPRNWNKLPHTILAITISTIPHFFSVFCSNHVPKTRHHMKFEHNTRTHASVTPHFVCREIPSFHSLPYSLSFCFSMFTAEPMGFLVSSSSSSFSLVFFLNHLCRFLVLLLSIVLFSLPAAVQISKVSCFSLAFIGTFYSDHSAIFCVYSWFLPPSWKTVVFGTNIFQFILPSFSSCYNLYFTTISFFLVSVSDFFFFYSLQANSVCGWFSASPFCCFYTICKLVSFSVIRSVCLILAFLCRKMVEAIDTYVGDDPLQPWIA